MRSTLLPLTLLLSFASLAFSSPEARPLDLLGIKLDTNALVAGVVGGPSGMSDSTGGLARMRPIKRTFGKAPEEEFKEIRKRQEEDDNLYWDDVPGRLNVDDDTEEIF